MTTTARPNPYELANREKKARSLVRLIAAAAPRGTLPHEAAEIVDRMTPDQRLAVCRAAGVKPASDATWALVRSILKEF